MKKSIVHKYIAEDKEHEISDETDGKAEQKLHKPVIAHFHTIHAHHLDKFFLFLQHN